MSGGSNLNPTEFQCQVQEKVKAGRSILLIAPTGLGKTFAVTGDIEEKFCKIVYAVPLRALGYGIRQSVSELVRKGKPIQPVIHHGNVQESLLFGEEVIITTYDQVVCAVPGLPLSLPLKAGHAVAGALLMSRLILDEAHLAWGISEQALPILLGIIDFRSKLGLQTVVLTATLPDKVAVLLSQSLGLELVIVGEGNLAGDSGLRLRESNRKVEISLLELQSKGKGDDRQINYGPLDERLGNAGTKCIYFANTVERLQLTYDRLVRNGVDPNKIVVLHNRMPRSWRANVEKRVHECFGKGSQDGNWLLLTNQVAEAGLDISAPLVASDPAPVDTLVQRAGRCARWFRHGITSGEFLVVTAPKASIEDSKNGLALPYRVDLVSAALKSVPQGPLTWQTEREWINSAWGGDAERAEEAVERYISQTDFALNLFDRAAQEHRPGEIAGVFREVISVEVAVEDAALNRDLQGLLDLGEYPETSTVSLGQAWRLRNNAKGAARVVRYEEGDPQLKEADYVQPGDILIVPSTVAYLHKIKGLCFGDALQVEADRDIVFNSEWNASTTGGQAFSAQTGKRQGLLEHSKGVMEGTSQRLTSEGAYRSALERVFKSLEPERDPNRLVDVIAQIATVASGFHDLGKADRKWQARAREIDPDYPDGLVGRTLRTQARMRIPHTSPGYLATIKACELLIGPLDLAEHLVRSIALAAVRHHSSLLNPASVDCEFEPHPNTIELVKVVLEEVGAPMDVMDRVREVLIAAQQTPKKDIVPLMLPNDDLFPVYALVGRAILMADRENASGEELEQWRAEA